MQGILPINDYLHIVQVHIVQVLANYVPYKDCFSMLKEFSRQLI